MIELDTLAAASGLSPKTLPLWSQAVASGLGYDRVSIPQKGRRVRDVVRPWVPLDRVLKQLHAGLQTVSGYVAPDAVHGFVKGRSIATNATQHLDQDVVLRIDLADFFGAIGTSRLMPVLSCAGLDKASADCLVGLTTVDGSLAQGFSTSPLLSNMAFVDSDRALAALADDVGARYTRYVDDLVFSGSIDTIHDALFVRIDETLCSLGWTVNPRKTRFMRRGRPQYVTGLYVGDKAGPHIPRSMKRMLRREVHFASRFGVANARLRSPTPMSIDRLAGWLHYAAHVDPSFGVPLRDKWFEIAPSVSAFENMHGWDAVLNDIGFPEHW